MFRSRSIGVAAAVAVTFSPTAAAAQSRAMTFQLAGQKGGTLAVTVEYLDPSVVNKQLAGSRALPVKLTVRNTSPVPVPFAYDAVRLVLDGDEALRPLPASTVVEEVRKLAGVPGIVRFIGAQASTFNPGALEPALASQQMKGGTLAANGSREGLLYFLKPPGFEAATFSGALQLEVDGHAPQLLSTSKVGVETKAPERPGYMARLKQLYGEYFAATPPSFDRSYALLVGIGQYRYLNKLESPVRDVQKMKAYLDAQGFDEVVTLLDEKVTPAAFRHPQRYLKAKMKANDRFIFYYSGHGMTAGHGLETRGYLPLVEEREDGQYTKSIPMIDLVGWLKGLTVQHLLVVLDSCFAGLAIDGTEVKGVSQANPKVDLAALHRMARGPARYLIMAGTAGQESFGGRRWDGSLFTNTLLTGLRRDADLYKDHIVTARELYIWLRPVVQREAEQANRQLNPMFVDLGPGGSSPGDFVFVQ
jgi:uncharacterized caspase-like protein